MKHLSRREMAAPLVSTGGHDIDMNIHLAMGQIMDAVGFAEARAHFDELLARVEAGETVAITREGKEVAVLSPPKKPLKRVDVATLRDLTDSMPMQNEDSGKFIRRMRDDARY